MGWFKRRGLEDTSRRLEHISAESERRQSEFDRLKAQFDDALARGAFDESESILQQLKAFEGTGEDSLDQMREVLVAGHGAEIADSMIAEAQAEHDAFMRQVDKELASSAPHRREAIPERVRHEVWRRDQGRCVECGSRERLEFDHIIPISQGGSNTARNIELRCEKHNRSKGANI